MLLFCLLNLSK
uniref:Uncharacterized protein n=1 Tax=Anguilla anguilla TaxID=7936 RepID=A0A0E9XT71_ANGAN